MDKIFFKYLFRTLVIITVAISVQQSFGQEIPVFKWAKSTYHLNCYLGGDIIITQSDSDGNAYMMGGFCNTFDADPSPEIYNLSADNTNYTDIFLIKYDTNGDFVWAKSFGDIFNNFPSALQIDASGNVFATIYNQLSYANYLTQIFKFDVDGNQLWKKTISTVKGKGNAMVLDAAQNILITGDFAGTVDFDPGAGVEELISNGSEADLFILKLDNDGNYLWAKGTGGTAPDRGTAIAIDPSGNIVVGGYYIGTSDLNPDEGVFNTTSEGYTDVFILKLNSVGDFVWAKSMGGADTDVLTSIAVNTQGNIFATGYFMGSGDYDPSAGSTMLAAAESIAGMQSDIFLMRLNPDGSFGWASGFGGAYKDEGRALITDAEGNVVFTGFFNGTVDFDPGPAVHNLVSIGQISYQNTFIVKLDENQELIWAQEIANPTNSATAVRTNAISIDNSGDITMGGKGQGDLDFRICSSSNVSGNGFIIKITTDSSPTITSFTPSSGVAGTQVVITGTGFSSTPSNNTVLFNTSEAVVTASTNTSITATVPTGNVSGPISVTTNCITVQSENLFGSPLAIEEYNSPILRIYPNPANNIIVIKTNENNINTKIEIIDISGRVVQSIESNFESEVIMDVSYLSAGSYFLKLQSEKGNAIKKFVKN